MSMFSFPSFTSAHSNAQVASKRRSVRNAQSDGSLLGSFREFTQLPATAFKGVRSKILSPQPNAIQQELEEKKSLLHLRLRSAANYEEWHSTAVELDRLEGNTAWKHEFESSEYNARLVQSRLKQLDEARAADDPNQLLFLVRTSLTRHLGGMGNIRLYQHSHFGTKHLIERYIDSALDTISQLLATTRRPGCELDSRIVLEQILQTRQSFGRSALLLSGGGTFGMNHIGVTKSLWEAKLLPRIISGASAGSIVCAILCSRTDDEMPALLEEFCYGDLDVFTKDGSDESLMNQVERFLKFGSFFDISNLTRVMKGLLGDMTFQEAYNRTRRILNICVSSASLYELPRLLNYVTAPNVVIWSAVAASCSVPIVFSPATLFAKDPRTGELGPWNSSPNSWIDGSVDNDLPMARLSEMFNVNHFIVSQVNPHVVPFLAREEGLSECEARNSDSVVDAGPSWLHTLTAVAKDEIMHRMHIASEIGIFPNIMTKLRSVLSQTYSGDITIFPEIPFDHFAKILTNPTTEFMLKSMFCGEKATWPQLSRVQNHCAIELALDDAVQQLRARVAFSPSQIDLRLQDIGRSGTSTGNHVSKAREEETSHKFKRLKPIHIDHPKRHSTSKVASLGNHVELAMSPRSSRGREDGPKTTANARRMPVSFHISNRSADHSHDPSDDDMADFLSPGMRRDHAYDSDESDDSADDTIPQQSRHLSILTFHDPTTADPSWSSNSRLFPHASQPPTPLRNFSSHQLSYFGHQSPRGPPSPVLQKSNPFSQIHSSPVRHHPSQAGGVPTASPSRKHTTYSTTSPSNSSSSGSVPSPFQLNGLQVSDFPRRRKSWLALPSSLQTVPGSPVSPKYREDAAVDDADKKSIGARSAGGVRRSASASASTLGQTNT